MRKLLQNKYSFATHSIHSILWLIMQLRRAKGQAIILDQVYNFFLLSWLSECLIFCLKPVFTLLGTLSWDWWRCSWRATPFFMSLKYYYCRKYWLKADTSKHFRQIRPLLLNYIEHWTLIWRSCWIIFKATYRIYFAKILVSATNTVRETALLLQYVLWITSLCKIYNIFWTHFAVITSIVLSDIFDHHDRSR